MAERVGWRFDVLHTLVAVATVAGASLTLIAPAAAATNPRGAACGYYANVSLGGGPYGSQGCPPQTSTYAGAGSLSPAVTLPAGGSSTLIQAVDSNGALAQYGPAVMFGGRAPADPNAPDPPSGSLTVNTRGTTTVTSQATVNNVGPQQFTADTVYAKCVATSTSHTWTATITRGVVVTSTDANGLPVTTVTVPGSPTANYKIHGTINNVGDSFDIVFNEHITNKDGTFTENAAHMYLLGPFAKGDLIIAQAKCGM